MSRFAHQLEFRLFGVQFIARVARQKTSLGTRPMMAVLSAKHQSGPQTSRKPSLELCEKLEVIKEVKAGKPIDDISVLVYSSE